ncbi:iron chelate uptake ABC transporter family permease subunit [Corynebacterium glucuronolyticum]|uniref:iron chelate uptake ABC transporter family permease subunit n=1 Tax=Corynebacterium glucuronolyticum TaxID=39791 RepID=UPI0021AF311F|nr:iron chelate uptake ABC transporter family permease subunit [Corynebacterium glucuronolyticum]MCT1563681.1 iron chelate uptake ABC transporter family permease subunit [Corynebacterium glucuronolyticum]
MTATVEARKPAKSRAWSLAAAVVVVAGLLVASLFTGVYDLSNDDGWEMFLTTRVPRAVALVLADAVMAMSGLVMQLITQNRFVDPTMTGTTEWAGLGLIAIMIVWPESPILVRMVAAIIAAIIGTTIFFLFLRCVSLRSSLVVPIVGIMLGAVVGAFSTFVALQFDMLQSLGVWFAGSFTAVIKGQYEVLWIVTIVLVVVWFIADRLTAAGLGEEVATNLGINYQQVMLIGTLLIAVATGVVTVVVGNLPFIGLIVPNIVSLMLGDNLRKNLPWVALLGVGTVTACDLIGRTIIMPFEIPVSVVLGVVGAVAFIALLVRTTKKAG